MSTEFICELAQIMLKLANVDQSIEAIHEQLTNGQALAKFEEMVVAQGGDLEDLHRPVKVEQVLEVTAGQDGVIAALPAMEFGLFAMRLGVGSCCQIGSALITKQGLYLTKKVGESRSKRGNVLPAFSWMKKFTRKRYRIQKNVKILEGLKALKKLLK